jgi:acyl carrier protein
MTRKEFLAHFDELIQENVGSTQGIEKLGELEAWDSLAVMGFIALVDEQFGITVSAQKVADAQTVDDLVGLLGDKIEG